MSITRPQFMLHYKMQALRDAYRGRSSMLAWNLCVVAGQRLIG